MHPSLHGTGTQVKGGATVPTTEAPFPPHIEVPGARFEGSGGGDGGKYPPPLHPPPPRPYQGHRQGEKTTY